MLAVFRVAVIFTYFIAINILLLLICIVRPFHRDNVYVAGKLYCIMGQLAGITLDIRVPDSVRTGGPFVFLANHQNSLDLITVCGASQKGMVTVGKKSLVWIPVFGWIYWLTGNILIDRKNKGSAHDTLAYTARKMQERRLSIFMFPEGTRSYGRGLLPFKTGAFRIAKESDEPIVLVSTTELQNKVKLNRWNNGVLIIEVSEPQPLPEDMDAKGCAKHFHSMMKSRIDELNQEVARLEKAG